MSPYDFPCDECEADDGEPCAVWCTSADVSAYDDYLSEPDVPGPHEEPVPAGW